MIATLAERHEAAAIRGRFLLPAALCALVASCAQPPAQPTGGVAQRAAGFEVTILEGHNRERAAVGLPPVAWDPAIALGAGNYARRLAASGRLAHAPRSERTGLGENLWMGTRGAFSPANMVDAWAAEKRRFRAGLFPAVSSTGNWADVGHYSQIIWPTTTRLGCALASNAASDFLVCRYAPAGNIDGRRVP